MGGKTLGEMEGNSEQVVVRNNNPSNGYEEDTEATPQPVANNLLHHKWEKAATTRLDREFLSEDNPLPNLGCKNLDGQKSRRGADNVSQGET